MRYFKNNYSALQKTIFVLIVILGIAYINNTWSSAKNDKFDQAQIIARSIVASLPLEALKALEAKPGDIDKPQYKVIKTALKAIIRVNTNARFAYLYTEQNGKIYIIADSESEESKDYSPPGQEYTEAKSIFRQPFKDGREQIAVSISDRWGTWTSVLIPIKDEVTGKTIAVFGMDFNAKSWTNFLLLDVIESSVSFVLLLLTLFLLIKIRVKNKLLNVDIINRKLAEQTLHNNETHLRTLLQTIPELIWLKDTDGVYLGCNTMFERYFGALEADIIGKTDFDFVDHELAEFFCEHDRQAMQAGKPTSNEEWITFADDGHRAFLETIKAPMYDVNGSLVGVLGIGRDITQRREAEDKLLESEIKYRAFFETSMDAILLTSPDGRTISANQAACTMFGYSEDELIKLGRLGIEDETDPRLSVLLAERKLNGKAQGEVTFIRKDGILFPAEISTSFFKNIEDLDRTSMIIRDITERNKIQNEIKFQAYLLNNVGQSVIATDLQGRVIYWNNASEIIYGWSAVEALGQNIFDLIASQQTKEEAVAIMKELSAGKNWSGEFVVKGKDGNKFPTYSTDTPIFDSEGNLTGMIGISNNITERKLAEKEIAMLAHALKSVTECVSITDTHNKILFVNESFLKTYGFESDELLGNHISKITSQNNDPKQANEILTATIQGEWQGELLNKRKNGTDFPIFLSTSVIMDKDRNPMGLIGVATDITIRKHAEETLIKLSRAVEQTADSIIITDRDGVIEYVNHAFEVLTGYASGEVLGKAPAILKSGINDSKYYKVLWNTILSGEVYRAEIVNKKKNGVLYDEEKTISPIFDKNNTITHFVSTGVDITKRKLAEKELISAKNKAEESDRLKSAFLANMSHEIRTPMNGILGFAGLLREPKLTGEEQQEYIDIIEQSGARMLNIINDIISISKIESGGMEVSVKETNINKQFEYIYTFFKPEAEKKGIHLHFKLNSPSKKFIIKSDKEKIYAILTNLVKNALKFTLTGTIEFGYIPIIDGGLSELKFYVKDSGVGINPEHQKFIFDRFRQSNEALNRNFEGAGLGLAISRAYAEMLGGKIWVESELGKGSTFYFTIPQNIEAEMVNITDDEKSADLDENQIHNLKILIAEDDDINEKFLTAMVKMYSNKILIAKTGAEAVITCHNNPDIDLILMDIKMPETDGYEATRQIRQFNTDVVIIAQTAFALTGDREKAIAAGCNDYIAKPYTKAILKSLIRKHFYYRTIN